MSVEFLSDDQARRYGCFGDEPSPAQLDRYFHLDDGDLAVVERRREPAYRLGFALQLGTVRFLGTFLADPTEVPVAAIAYVAAQLRDADPGCLKDCGRSRAHWSHVGEICRRYGYRDFDTQPGYFAFLRWLCARAWVGNERPSVLFDLATARLVEHKVLLPGVSRLARMVASVRHRASMRAWRILAGLPDAECRARLERLLVVPEGSRQSGLDRLRHGPRHATIDGLVESLGRLVELRSLGVEGLELSGVPTGRVEALAREASSAWAATIGRRRPERRIATLAAFAGVMLASAHDDVCELFDAVVGQLLARVERAGQRQRLASLADFDTAALLLREVSLVVLDAAVADVELRKVVFERVSRPRLEAAAQVISSVAQVPGDRHYDDLLSRYPHVRRFLPRLLAQVGFEGSESAGAVLAAWRFLADAETGLRSDFTEAPVDVVSRAWKSLVCPEAGGVDRRAYTFCVLEAMRAHLRGREVFVPASRRFADPRAQLLSGPGWETARPQVCRTLGLPLDAEPFVAALGTELDAAYRRTAENLSGNASVDVERQNGRDRLRISPLDRLAEPGSLITLRQALTALMPKVDLPEVLLEVAGWTGFDTEFTHVSESAPRVADLRTSVCAVLLAEACNLGLEPVCRADRPALSRGRLAWVAQNYLRADTLTRANCRLVDYQAGIPLARRFGGGEVASADGLRFVVPVHSVHAGPNRRYFGAGRGVTYYNFSSDQFTGFHAIVIPGTLRDSLFILDGLLDNPTSLEPTEVMADTAGYSDVVFGLFRLLGYQFSPRMADAGDARFWRIDPAARYGPLNGVARHRIDVRLVASHWDDILRLAGSLATRAVNASQLMRTLQRGPRAWTLARAVGEVGRVAKTLYLLAYIDDEDYRRRILTQLNRGEGRHSLARRVFHGQQGHLHQPYREGQEDQLGALGLVLNAIVLWNTRYLDRALNHLLNQGRTPATEDIARVSPLVCDHINLHGRYQFTLDGPAAHGQLRPLPNSA